MVWYIMAAVGLVSRGRHLRIRALGGAKDGGLVQRVRLRISDSGR